MNLCLAEGSVNMCVRNYIHVSLLFVGLVLLFRPTTSVPPEAPGGDVVYSTELSADISPCRQDSVLFVAPRIIHTITIMPCGGYTYRRTVPLHGEILQLMSLVIVKYSGTSV